MPDDPRRCPKCDAFNTTVQHTEFRRDTAVQIRTCEACPTEYEVVYGNPMTRVNYYGGDDDDE